ncbi:MAG: PHP domain-containing protein [Proteobacteria bacterium]|nr:PHP domain-containing protein [Pseudomonadota bacterium]
MHSTVSDGRLAPAALIELAARERVEVCALTDHDELAGIEEARACGERLGVRVLAGIEISVSARDGDLELHLLGIGFDPDFPELRRRAAEWRADRAERARRMLAQLRASGVEIEFSHVERLSGGAIGRPHVARALVERGICRDEDEAFRRLLRRGRPGYVARSDLEPREAIDLIHAAGGLASLAHPPRSRGADAPGGLEAFVERLARLGLDALEVQHPAHRPGQVRRLRRLCRELDLIETGGSDFHGAPGERPGRIRGRLAVGGPVWDGIRQKLENRAG